MNWIPTRVHGILDYLSGVFFTISPWALGFATGGPAQWIPVLVGIMVLIMSFFTRYELGVIRMISMRTHLTIDVLAGALLAVSPWLFGFATEVFWPHLILGLWSATAASLSRSTPTVTQQVR